MWQYYDKEDKISSGTTLGSPQFWLHFPFPEGFLALIREKRALMCWDSHDSVPIRLSGAILKMKMTANSTYWMANLRVIRSGVAGGGTPLYLMFSGQVLIYTKVGQYLSPPPLRIARLRIAL